MTGPQPPRDDLGYPVRVARPARRAVSLNRSWYARSRRGM